MPHGSVPDSGWGSRARAVAKDTERNITNKIARGGFTAAFFLQCMEAIGVRNLQLADGD
jgi:hypothetical protein